ncbi:MAG: DUF5721 family protein [Cellulosilyticaceae bacterium]
MELYTIAQRKLFMNKLLKSELFDNFELREALIHTSFKTIVDGTRNKDFFSSIEDLPTPPAELSTYITWREARPYIYQLILGDKSPSYFKIILSLSQKKAHDLSADIDTCFINLIFKEGTITCTTGVAYKNFTLDKTPDTLWDERIKQFLFKYAFL